MVGVRITSSRQSQLNCSYLVVDWSAAPVQALIERTGDSYRNIGIYTSLWLTYQHKVQDSFMLSFKV